MYLQGIPLKKTPARKVIIDIVEKAHRPISAQDIIDELSRKKIPIDRVTVFRNVKTLVENDVLIKIDFGDGTARYELKSAPHHHHLVCSRCKNISDIESETLHDQIESVMKKAQKNYGFTIEEHKIEFFGKCKKCT